MFDQVGGESTADMDEYTPYFRLIRSYDHLNQAGGWLPPLTRTGRNRVGSAKITFSELPSSLCPRGQRERVDFIGLLQATASILRHHLVQLHQGSFMGTEPSVVALLTD